MFINRWVNLTTLLFSFRMSKKFAVCCQSWDP